MVCLSHFYCWRRRSTPPWWLRTTAKDDTASSRSSKAWTSSAEIGVTWPRNVASMLNKPNRAVTESYIWIPLHASVSMIACYQSYMFFPLFLQLCDRSNLVGPESRCHCGEHPETPGGVGRESSNWRHTTQPVWDTQGEDVAVCLYSVSTRWWHILYRV